VRTVTLPAFELRNNAFPWAMLSMVTGGSAGILIGSPAFSSPARGEDLDISNQVGALLLRKSVPDWHIGIDYATDESVVKIFIGRQSSSESGPALECGEREVAWLGSSQTAFSPLASP